MKLSNASPQSFKLFFSARYQSFIIVTRCLRRTKMEKEKSDRLRSMLQEALSPLIMKIEMLEVEITSLKEEQRELITKLKNQ